MRTRWHVALVTGLVVAGGLGLGWNHAAARPAYVPRNVALRDPSLYVYPPGQIPPRATIVFLGNDVGFWNPHKELAEYLASEGYGVVGIDVRPILHSVGDLDPAARDSVVALRFGRIIEASMDEFGATKQPLIIMGHSLGAELAIWTASRLRVPQLAGVVAMSPGARGHLHVSLSDLLETAEPTEPGSFSVAGEVRSMRPDIQVVVVRGSSDKYRYADPAIIAAAPSRVTTMGIPFASHSLKRIVIAKYVVRNAIDLILKRESRLARAAS